MPSPVSDDDHGAPHADFVGWLAHYRAFTPGVRAGDNSTLHLDIDNEPQPDGYLRILPEFGGRTQTVEGYIEGGPELVAEVAASSASYDLHDKLNAYRRNGVQEYVVWRVWDRAVDWFVLRSGRYERLAATSRGLLQSEVLPGLWLDPAALVSGDMARVLQVLQEGIASPEHAAFVARLQQEQAKRTALKAPSAGIEHHFRGSSRR